MSGQVPLLDEGGNLVTKVVEIGEVGNFKTFALEDSEPLLDLVHPGAVYRDEVKLKAWMFG